MQVYGVVMGWGQVLRSCTRVEAHLALVKFRPHSILHRGIKTQTWLLLWRIIDHTLILPSSPHERRDAEKASFCWSLYLCDQSSETTEVSCYLAAAFFFPVLWEIQSLENPSDQTCQKKEFTCNRGHPSSQLEKGDRLDECITERITFQRLDWMSWHESQSLWSDQLSWQVIHYFLDNGSI